MALVNNSNFDDTGLTFYAFIWRVRCGCAIRVSLDLQYSDIRFPSSLDHRLASWHPSNIVIILYCSGGWDQGMAHAKQSFHTLHVLSSSFIYQIKYNIWEYAVLHDIKIIFISDQYLPTTKWFFLLMASVTYSKSPSKAIKENPVLTISEALNNFHNTTLG